jgi:broad specificity phosphatase PhoE
VLNLKELSANELLPKLPDIDNTEQTEETSFASFQKRAKSAVQELIYTEKNNPIMLLTLL